jgi:DNA-binding protein HU-beta
MNKAELVDAVAASLAESKANAERYLNAVLDAIRDGTKKDESCAIIGFGTFALKRRKARTGRNPQTGLPIEIKASTTVGFKPSQKFKDFV